MHVLAVTNGGAGALRELRAVVAGLADGGQLTIVTLALREREGRGCCDVRAPLWNRERAALAREDLECVQALLGDDPRWTCAVVVADARSPAAAVAAEALRREADVVLALDGLARPDRRRLARRRAVPVVTAARELDGLRGARA